MEADTIGAWETIWKALFIITLTVFSLMSVWVTIGGFRDLKTLFRTLKDSEQSDDS